MRGIKDEKGFVNRKFVLSWISNPGSGCGAAGVRACVCWCGDACMCMCVCVCVKETEPDYFHCLASWVGELPTKKTQSLPGPVTSRGRITLFSGPSPLHTVSTVGSSNNKLNPRTPRRKKITGRGERRMCRVAGERQCPRVNPTRPGLLPLVSLPAPPKFTWAGKRRGWGKVGLSP